MVVFIPLISKLLIGIKKIKLDPVLIKVLDSGVGVYRSPFTDIVGSLILFAGPHPSLTRVNGGLKQEITHAVFHARLGVEPHEIPEPPRQYAFVADKQTQILLYPTPFTKGDILDAGGEPPFDYLEGDKIITQAEYSGLEAHFCSAFKATIPIFKMRELLNKDDKDNLVTFRCPSCSKYITCKK